MDESERRALQDGVNPAYVPRNHVMQEAVKLADQGDYSEVRPPRRVFLSCIRAGEWRQHAFQSTLLNQQQGVVDVF